MTVQVPVAAAPTLEKWPVAAAPSYGSSTVGTASGESPSSSDDGNAIDPMTYRYDGINRKYRVDPEIIGAGHQGTVRACTDRAAVERFAAKTVRRSAVSRPDDLSREIALLREMNHEGIVRLVDVFEDSENVHLVTDLCEGGKLFDRIVERASKMEDGEPCFEEEEAKAILCQVLEAVSYMHANDVVHRDIKPENILFETEDVDSPIKVIDFGLAQKHRGGDPPMTRIDGTPYYVAPEVLRGSYDRSCDLWSVGVLAYMLLTGYPPFDGHDEKEIYRAISLGRCSFDRRYWNNSSEAKDFVRGLLRKQPKKRMTADEALRHPWIVGRIDISSRDSEGPRASNKVSSLRRIVSLEKMTGKRDSEGPRASNKGSSLRRVISLEKMTGKRLFGR